MAKAPYDQEAARALQESLRIPSEVQRQRDLEARRIQTAELQPDGGGMIPSSEVLGGAPPAVAPVVPIAAALPAGGNEYDALLKDDTRQNLRSSMFAAVRSNPEQAGEARRLERTTDVPAAVAERNLDEVRQRAQLNEYDKLLETSPVTVKKLSDSTFAKLAHDDTANLAAVERGATGSWSTPGATGDWLSSVQPSPERGVLAGLYEPVLRGLARGRQLGTLLGSELGIYKGADAERAVRLAQQSREIGAYVQPAEIQRGLQEISGAQTMGEALSAIARNPRAVLEVTLESMGTSAPSMLMGLAGAATGGPAGAASGVFAGSFVTEYASVLGEAITESSGGQSDPRAWDLALNNPELLAKAREKGALRGVPIALFDAMTAGLAGKLLRGASPTVGSVASRVAGEMGLQAGGGAAGEAVAQAVTGEYKPGDILLEALAEIPTGLFEVYGNIKLAQGSAQTRIDEEARKADAATRNAQVFANLDKLAEASKVRERDPQSFAEFVDAAAESAPVQDVYVDARIFASTLQQSGTNPEALGLSPEVRTQFEEAVRLNSDLRIPLGEYAATVAGTDTGKALLQHLKTEPEGMSQAEADTFYQTQQEMLKAESEKILAERETDAAWATSAKAVSDNITAQLAQANRFTPDVNNAYAAMMRDFYAVTAHRLGITPEEMFQRYPLRIAAENVAAENALDQPKPLPDDLPSGERDPAQPVYLRIGKWDPKNERSKNFAMGAIEPGLSAYDLDPAGKPITPAEGEWSAEDMADRLKGGDPKYLVQGDLVGQGHDGEPLLQNVRVVGHWGENILEQSMSTRVPFTKKAGAENPLSAMLTIGLDAMKADPKAFAKNIAVISRYPNFPANPGTTDPAARAEIFINMAVDNLLWLYDQVPAATRDRSKLWYEGARAIVDRWVQKYNLTDVQVSGVLAVLSPQKDWFQNVSLAERVLDILTGQQEHEWDAAMTETAERIFSNPKDQESLAAIEGQPLYALDNSHHRAMWLRTYDEAHNSRQHRIITPEGNFGPAVTIDSGEEGGTGWGSLVEIGKAVSVVYDGSIANVSAQLGTAHKVRNFYNNIFDPNDPFGSVTVDTHAVAAANLLPLAGTSPQASHNFGSSVQPEDLAQWGNASPSAMFGAKGVYGLYAEAYRRAAELRGVLPRELQSITWEAVRGLFSPEFKRNQQDVDIIDALWLKHRNGEATLDDTRRAIIERAGGIAAPEWEQSGGGGAETAWASTYTGELLEPGVSGGDAGPAAAGIQSGDGRGVEPAPARLFQGGVGRDPGVREASEQAREAAGGVAPLEGLPNKPLLIEGEWYFPGPLAIAHASAHAYLTEAGLPQQAPRTFQKVDVDRAQRIAQAYDEMAHAPNDPEVQAAYAAMIAETAAQYRAILKTGLKIEFIDAEQGDPYAATPRLAIKDVIENNHLWVFSTRDGFGTDAAFDPSQNPLLAETEFKISGKTALANDLFRVVHDYFGHIKDGAGFRADGEEHAWRSHSAMYSPLARRAMTSETRGQNSWVNFGPHGETNRTATSANTVYADQKTGLMPAWVSEEGMLDPLAQPVYHGSPTVFDKFSLHAIGSGEGAQSYGWGLYFTTKKEIAEWYRRMLTPLEDESGQPVAPGGRLYTVEIPEDDTMLDYDKPLSEQPEKVQAALARTGGFEALDGAEIYRKLSQELGSPEAASHYLAGLGIDGLKYQGRSPGETNYVVFDDQAIEIAGYEQTARGQISFGSNIQQGATITLLRSADLSTFLHESGHFFLEVLADIASQPEAPAQVQQDMAALLKWFEVKGDKERSAFEVWQGMTLDEKRPHHEQFARGFEAYLFEGGAPTTELQSLFNRFRSWLLNVYKSLMALNVELMPEVRGVFDRMLATDEQIAAAETARGYAPLFGSAAEMGATADEWARYQALSAEATQEALDGLQTRSLRDMQWLTGARGRELKKLQAAAADKRKAVRREIEAEVRAEPVYAAMRFIRYGELGEADRTNRERRILDTVAGSSTKLALPALKELYGEGPAAPWRYLPAGKSGLVSQEGALDPELAAELFGFRSGDHMVKEILAAEPERQEIESRTDQRMLERHGDLTDPAAVTRAANAAIHNEVRARFIATELNALAKAIGSPRVLAKAAKVFADQLIARKRLRDIRASQYAAAEARAAKAAQRASSLTEKATEKRNQLVNHYAAKAADAAVDEVEQGVAYLKRMATDTARRTVDPDYLDQIHKLLERVELRQTTNREIDRRKSLAAWVAEQRAMGFEPTVDPEQVAEARRQHYRDMTLEEFRGLVDNVKNIEHLGRLKTKLLTAKDKREFDAVVSTISQSIATNATGTVAERRTSDRAPLVAVGRMFRNFMADHRKFASLAREFDGWKDDGSTWNFLVRNMNDAGNEEAVEREKITIKLGELFKEMMKGGRLGKKMDFPSMGKSFTREERISIALNWGNDTNRERIMTGERLTQAQVQQILDTLTRDDWKFVQGVWDYMAIFRPEMGAQQKRLTGIEPEWVEATPVVTRFGIMQGGYYPIKADPLRSTRAESDLTYESAQAIRRGGTMTRSGHLKDRAESTGRPLRYDLSVIPEHLDQVVHNLAWTEYLIDARRLLHAPAIDAAIRKHYGEQKMRVLLRTLDDIAVGEIEPRTAADMLFSYARKGATIVGMGWSLTTPLLQPLGLTQSVARIGAKWVLKGAWHWMGDAFSLERSVANIYEKSDFMRLRSKTMQREISEIRNRIRKGGDSKIEASYFYLIQKLQLVADLPTWWGQYEKSMAQNGMTEEKAIALADQAVIDAQGSGQAKDLARVQRGGEGLKLFTNFYSFFNTTYNNTVEVVGRTNFRRPDQVALLAVDLLLLYTLPAALATILKAALGADWDDEEKLAKRFIADQLTYLFGTVVLLREVSAGLQSVAGLPGDYSGPAALRVFNEVNKLAKQTRQIFEGGEADAAFWKSLNSSAGLILHYPAGQVNRTVEGIAAMADGKTENPGALIVGPGQNR